MRRRAPIAGTNPSTFVRTNAAFGRTARIRAARSGLIVWVRPNPMLHSALGVTPHTSLMARQDIREPRSFSRWARAGPTSTVRAMPRSRS